jgi:maltooligosyltrehalose trehalohydrolase
MPNDDFSRFFRGRDELAAHARLPHCWGPRQIAPDTWDLALWAPSSGPISLHRPDGRTQTMQRDADGVHRTQVRAGEGERYRFELNGVVFADPGSLQQADGVEGWSVLRDLRGLRPARNAWRGRSFDEAVFCELHVGTFTAEGTFAAAARSPNLRRLAQTGITAIELMPVGQFPGTRGWGYDSVLPWAVQHSYGSPEDLAALVAEAQGLGMMVFLDVVFNHFGPVGTILPTLCPEFFLQEESDWGPRFDFTHPEVRAYFIGCALHWIEAYGFDGLRIDALHEMQDASDPPVAVDLARAVRKVPWDRTVHLVAEDSSNQVGLYHPAAGLYDASWDDDYHHALHVMLTGESFGYYADFTHDPQGDLLLALRDGQAMQGQPRPGGARKGEPSGDLPPAAFVNFNLNHDHAGNRPKGERLVSLIGVDRALVAHAFLLSAPYIPLILMGEEIGSRQPFPWFADYDDKLARQIRAGRTLQFKSLPHQGADMLDPFDPGTMHLCHPYGDREPDDAALWLRATAELLDLRHNHLLPVFRSGRSLDTEVRQTGPQALGAQWHFNGGSLLADLSFATGTTPPPSPKGTRQLYALGGAGTPWFRLGLRE